MNVKTSAFIIEITNATNEDFFIHLKSDFLYDYQNKVLIVDKIDGRPELWGGYLMSLRDYRVRTSVTYSANELEVILEHLEANKHDADFNFFLFNQITGKGIFQHYHSTPRWSGFKWYLSHRFNKFRSSSKNKDAVALISPIFKEDSLEIYLKEISLIKEIQLEGAFYRYQNKGFRQLAAQANRKIHTLKYYKQADVSFEAIKEGLLELISENNVPGLKIKGEIDGVEKFYDIANNIDILFQEEYNEWLRHLSFSGKDIRKSVNQSAMIKHLLTLYNTARLIARLDESE